MRAQFERIRGENFSLIAFEAAWIVGGNMSKDVSPVARAPSEPVQS